MASPLGKDLEELDKPQAKQINLEPWQVTRESVQEYLDSVGDSQPVYQEWGLAPPLALASRSLGILLAKLQLPGGAIHSLQEVESLGPVPVGCWVGGTAEVAPPRRRGSLEFITVSFSLSGDTGTPLLAGKSMVLVTENTGPGDPPASRQEASPQTSEGDGDLPTSPKTITQAQLNHYALVSGDNNPLHLDPAFAATTQFGGIIAHGMLTLAFVSEMLTSAFGRAWLTNGSLKVRFKGAAYLQDRVQAWGRVTKEEKSPDGRITTCAVGVRNSATGQDLISGSATISLQTP